MRAVGQNESEWVMDRWSDRESNGVGSPSAVTCGQPNTSGCRPSTRNTRRRTRRTPSAQYAARRGIEIVRTYADEGKSGLRLDGRDALKQLIDDVQSGRADFTTILVYDVSRWGRFQDADESAYYEYICKRAGISVQYCAEQFENDGSPVSTIVKGVKRAMAGEYSRELSVKVFAGQCRLIELGYRQGGPPGFGLRRSLIDQSWRRKGRARARRAQEHPDRPRRSRARPRRGGRNRPLDLPVLRRREEDRARDRRRDSTQRGIADRSRPALDPRHRAPGPDQREIHRQQRLEPRLVQAEDGSAFTTARRCGFGPTAPSRPSSIGRCSTPPRRSSARDRFGCPTTRCSKLCGSYCRTAAIFGLVIDESEHLPSSSAYQSRFGSLLRAYQLVGFTPDRDYRYIEINRALRRMHPRDRGGRPLPASEKPAAWSSKIPKAIC